LPDGGRLTATIPTKRVQHYGSDGGFRNGWFVSTKGGLFAIGLTSDGRVAVCNARGREFIVFDLDGRPVDHQACLRGPNDISTILQPADFPSGNLQPVSLARRPHASLGAILMVPLWHPFVSWTMLVVGVFVAGPARSAVRPSR